jgi:hypothetical protein
MLNAIKSNRSLTFYQPVPALSRNINSSPYTGSVSSVALANDVFITSATTTSFNNQLSNYLNILNTKRDLLTQKVQQGLSNDPGYKSARSDGVKLAWEYEQADVDMGGKGSANWNRQQRNEIQDRGHVRGAEGHHQKNVANHPEEQANPDNIKFYKDRDSHLDEGHGGDFHNETDGPMIDKNKMLKDTNSKRVFKNEVSGLGIAVAIGAGVGATIGFVVSLAQSGVNPESIRMAAIEGTKGGFEGGILSAASYGIGRTIGEVATKASAGLLSNLGVNITENIMQMCNMAVIGVLTITVFSAYQFIKLKRQGMATREALFQVGKQALFSLSLLAVAIAAQGILGGPAGIVVSISIGVIFIAYKAADLIHTRQFTEELRVYVINKACPTF